MHTNENVVPLPPRQYALWTADSRQFMSVVFHSVPEARRAIERYLNPELENEIVTLGSRRFNELKFQR